MEKKFALIALACLVAGACQAQIINASFENDFVGFQNLSSGTPITGWSSGGSNQGSWDIRSDNPLFPVPWAPFWSQLAPAGFQIAYVNFGALAQQTGFTLQAGTQTFSVFAGRRGDSTVAGGDISTDIAMEIWAGGTVASGNVSGGTLLASRLIQMSTIQRGAFAQFNLSTTATSSSAQLGQNLTIRFANAGNAEQINIDNVTFTPVPEPASLAILGAGALALIRKRKGKKA